MLVEVSPNDDSTFLDQLALINYRDVRVHKDIEDEQYELYDIDNLKRGAAARHNRLPECHHQWELNEIVHHDQKLDQLPEDYQKRVRLQHRNLVRPCILTL
jgi:hypothetical protein